MTITDPLDTANIDLETVSLGPISFGNVIVTPPAGVDRFTTDVDLRPDHDILVRIKVDLDQETGLLTWKFTSIDPATGKLPDDPLAGFLPPNLVPPEGDGSVLFTVMPKPGLATNTEITNDASIVFDTNAPIMTPAWSNLLDNSSPESDMSPLAATQGSTDFVIEWGGVDEGAGIKDYTVFVSVDNGPYEPAFLNTDATSRTYSGEDGRSYDFYTVARDRAGNVEETPIFPDVSTTVRLVRSVRKPAVAISSPLVVASQSPAPDGSSSGFAFTVSSHIIRRPAYSCDASSDDILPAGVEPADCATFDPVENDIAGGFFLTGVATDPASVFVPPIVTVEGTGPAGGSQSQPGAERRDTPPLPILRLASRDVGADLIPDQIKRQGLRGPEAGPSLPPEHRRRAPSLVGNAQGSLPAGMAVLLALLLAALLWFLVSPRPTPGNAASRDS